MTFHSDCPECKRNADTIVALEAESAAMRAELERVLRHLTGPLVYHSVERQDAARAVAAALSTSAGSRLLEALREARGALALGDCCHGNGFNAEGERIHRLDCEAQIALAKLKEVLGG